MRVVSLLPSATEIVLALAGNEALRDGDGVRLVGRSHECDWPPEVLKSGVPTLTAARTRFESSAQVDREVRAALKASGQPNGAAGAQTLYALDVERLKSLRPDVIVTQDLCAVCSIDLSTVRAAAATMTPPPQVVSLNPETFEGMFDDILTVGEALGLGGRATELVVQLRERAYRVEEYVNAYTAKPRVGFLEWTDPLFVGGHWTPQLIERAGGEHPLNPTAAVEGAGAGEGPIGQTLRRAGKSTTVSDAAFAASEPEMLVICPCGLSLDMAWRETEILSRKAWWKNLPAVQRGKVAIVDGNQYFSRPGPRLVDGLEFLVGFLNDREEIIPDGFAWKRWKA